MARKRNTDITAEEFRELMREINKRLLIAGLIVVGFGLLIIALVAIFGGAHG